VAMLPFSRAILLVSIWVGDVVGVADFGEETMEFLVLVTPIHLDHDNFPIKEMLYKFLEFNKGIENLRFKPQGIYLREFAIIINKAHIILFVPNRFRSITPNIGINKFSRMTRTRI
jgi:hypothetical protein